MEREPRCQMKPVSMWVVASNRLPCERWTIPQKSHGIRIFPHDSGSWLEPCSQRYPSL